MSNNREALMDRLIKHSEDYVQGRTQDFSVVCEDCRLAANMIRCLYANKHTQKRARNRLSSKNKELRNTVKQLTKSIESLSILLDEEEVGKCQ